MEWMQREKEEIGKWHGCFCSRLQLPSYCGLMFPHLELLRLSRLHGAVPQGHLANIRPFHEAGMISETTVFLQVSAGWNLQTGLECFEQKPTGS